jgi:hypothetical protein
MSRDLRPYYFGFLSKKHTSLKEDDVAKGQKRSNREKKKPKQDKKKVTSPSASPFASSGPRANSDQERVSKKRR